MSHDEIEASLGALALDALEGEERDIVEAHLLECLRCRAEVEEHRFTVSLLAFSGEQAPPAPWERIAAVVEPSPPALRLRVLRRKRSWLQSVPAGLAAAAVVLLVVSLGAVAIRADRRVTQLEELREAGGRGPLDVALGQPGTRRLQLVSGDGRLQLRGAITADNRGTLLAGPLPALPVDRTYQLWGIIDDRRVSLGVLGPDPDVVSFDPRLFTRFALTEEAAPGVAESVRPALVIGEVES